jgi:putative serine protease PepD
VASVTTGSPAEVAGLREGDEIVTLNGEAPSRNPAFWLRSYSPGQTIALHIRREGQEQEIQYALGSREEREYSIEEIAKPAERQSRIRAGFLHGTTD